MRVRIYLVDGANDIQQHSAILPDNKQRWMSQAIEEHVDIG